MKARVEKNRKSRRAAPYRFRPTTASETTAYNHSSLHQHQQQQKKPGLCFLCGSAGHWKSECPNNKNLKLSIPSTGFCIGSEGLVNSICLDSSISGFISNQPSNVTVEQVSNNEIIVNHGIAGFQTESDFQLNDNSFVSPCGRLKQNSHAWRSITDNEHILSIVENGYRIPFKQLPDVQKSKNNKSARDNPDFVKSEISSLLSKGCISEVTTEPHVINPLTVAFNRKGKPRLVLDCRNVNNCLHKFKYKYEDIQTARLMFEKGTFMFSFDIRGAYHHIDIYPEHRTFLGFSWTENGQIKLYVFNSLPFGLATAGHVFSKVVRTIVKFWRSMGVKVITFLDDGLGGDISYENALLASNFIKESIQNFGFLLANEKCDWDPKLQSVWLGHFICMKSGRLFITEERISRLELAIGSLLSQLKGQFLQIVPARFAASIAGQIISLQNVLGKIVRLKTREMYKCINSRLSWDSPVYISEEAVIELNFWLKSVRDLNCKGTDFKENLDFELSLFCDASSSGYGGYIEMNVSDGSDRYAGTSQEVGSLSLAQAHGASLDNDSPFFLIFGSEKPNVRKHDKIRSPEVDTFKSNSIVSPEVETYGGREMGHKKHENVENVCSNALSSEKEVSVFNLKGLNDSEMSLTYADSFVFSPEVETMNLDKSKEVQNSELSSSLGEIIQESEVIGTWNDSEKGKSSTWREAEAVKRVIFSNAGYLKGKKVKVFTDNKNICTVLQAGSSKGDLQAIAVSVNEICKSNAISLSMCWIPRKLNERADYLSRCIDSDDWEMHDWVFLKLDREWGPHTIDRFASDYNHKCSRYNTRWWVPGTEGVNALDQNWGEPECNWLVPPPRLIPSVLRKLELESAEGTLIIPEWPSAPFYPLLFENGRRKPFIVGLQKLPRTNIIKAGRGNNGIFVKQPLPFDLLALKLKCR